MADVFTKAKRSAVMSRIRGKGNRDTELALMKLFRLHGITGWRRHQKVFGKPDFLFRKARLAVFVDGCFWHGCPRCFRQPKSNRIFWTEKIAGNKKRDLLVGRVLRKQGWRVVRIWEHDLARQSVSSIHKIQAALRPDS
jgi:DNA mismatch endonuclease (patch repair protein)